MASTVTTQRATTEIVDRVTSVDPYDNTRPGWVQVSTETTARGVR